MSLIGNSPAESEPSWNQFDTAVQESAREFQQDEATPVQALVAGLIAQTIIAYQKRSLSRQIRRGFPWLFAGPLAACLVYGVVAAGSWIVDQLGIPRGNSILVGISVVLAAAAMFSRYGVMSPRIDLIGKPKFTRLRLGRCETATDFRRLGWLGLLICALFALQTSLLQFADIGFESRYSLSDSLLLTLDNVLHGILFDLCELYGIHFGPDWEHNLQTSTLFLLFRVAFDVLVGVSLYIGYCSREVQLFLRDFPADSDRRSEICLWIDDRMRDSANWTRQFGAECVFLQMVRMFLEGRNDDVRELDHVLPAVQITPAVRSLLLAPAK